MDSLLAPAQRLYKSVHLVINAVESRVSVSREMPESGSAAELYKDDSCPDDSDGFHAVK